VQVVRVVFAVAGGVLAVLTVLSVVRVLVIPRPRPGGVQRAVDRAVDAVFHWALRATDDYDTRDRVLSAEAAAILLGLLLSWLALFTVAFTLLLWPNDGSLGSAAREAVSSLFTLGFAYNRHADPTVLDALAALCGLVVIAVQIAYLPTLYAAFNRRETEVTLLNSRAGLPPWGPELLARTRYGIRARTDDLPELYAQWERWAADVAESHSNYPVLVRFRSPQPRSSWLVGLLAVMDSAAMLLALCPSRDRIEPRLCIRMGFTALQQIAAALGIAYDADPSPDGAIALTYADFEPAVQRLVDVGFPVERSARDAWPHFRGWRVNYEAVAYAIAERTDAVPAYWSGPRAWPATEIAPFRPPNRAPSDASSA
jgi:hypothetical protein